MKYELSLRILYRSNLSLPRDLPGSPTQDLQRQRLDPKGTLKISFSDSKPQTQMVSIGYGGRRLDQSKWFLILVLPLFYCAG